MNKEKKSIRPVRWFSENVKKQTVKDIERCKCSVSGAAQELDVSIQSIYKWLYKYSSYLQQNKRIIVENKSEAYQSNFLKSELEKAEAALGRKQMEIDFLNKLIEIASAEFKTDIKKNFTKKLSNGLGLIKE